jgi:hypothetical protein
MPNIDINLISRVYAKVGFPSLNTAFWGTILQVLRILGLLSDRFGVILTLCLVLFLKIIAKFDKGFV